MDGGRLERYAAEIAEHKRDPYSLVEEIVGGAVKRYVRSRRVRHAHRSQSYRDCVEALPARHRRETDYVARVGREFCSALIIWELRLSRWRRLSPFTRSWGLAFLPEETVEQEKVRLVMVPVGESRLELLEATSDDSTIAKFIAKRGRGAASCLYAGSGSGGCGGKITERWGAAGVE